MTEWIADRPDDPIKGQLHTFNNVTYVYRKDGGQGVWDRADNQADPGDPPVGLALVASLHVRHPGSGNRNVSLNQGEEMYGSTLSVTGYSTGNVLYKDYTDVGLTSYVFDKDDIFLESTGVGVIKPPPGSPTNFNDQHDGHSATFERSGRVRIVPDAGDYYIGTHWTLSISGSGQLSMSSNQVGTFKAIIDIYRPIKKLTAGDCPSTTITIPEIPWDYQTEAPTGDNQNEVLNNPNTIDQLTRAYIPLPSAYDGKHVEVKSSSAFAELKQDLNLDDNGQISNPHWSAGNPAQIIRYYNAVPAGKVLEDYVDGGSSGELIFHKQNNIQANRVSWSGQAGQGWMYLGHDFENNRLVITTRFHGKSWMNFSTRAGAQGALAGFSNTEPVNTCPSFLPGCHHGESWTGKEITIRAVNCGSTGGSSGTGWALGSVGAYGRITNINVGGAQGSPNFPVGHGWSGANNSYYDFNLVPGIENPVYTGSISPGSTYTDIQPTLYDSFKCDQGTFTRQKMFWTPEKDFGPGQTHYAYICTEVG